MYERKDRGDFPEAAYNQEFILKHATNHQEEVCRCHWLLADDGVTIRAGGFPNPKEINWRGLNFHRFKSAGHCEYCMADIPQDPTGEQWE
ncbi:MAG TPA: hypothetical protein VER03_07210 [Bryobacteraceae bacterium]|nr:hypothetical protein [Bryobacteraceae bacterium]